jgi:hypothetical protein
VDDAIRNELRKYYDEGETIELLAAIGAVQLLQSLQQCAAHGTDEVKQQAASGFRRPSSGRFAGGGSLAWATSNLFVKK